MLRFGKLLIRKVPRDCGVMGLRIPDHGRLQQDGEAARFRWLQQGGMNQVLGVLKTQCGQFALLYEIRNVGLSAADC